MRSAALIGRGLPTIPMLPVWSMTTSANEPPRSPCVCQKGTVIEQSEVPILHSVIHSSDLNVCSPAAGARTRNWVERLRNGSNTLRKCPLCISGVSRTQSTQHNKDHRPCSARQVPLVAPPQSAPCSCTRYTTAAIAPAPGASRFSPRLSRGAPRFGQASYSSNLRDYRL